MYLVYYKIIDNKVRHYKSTKHFYQSQTKANYGKDS